MAEGFSQELILNKIIYPAIDELNSQNPEKPPLEKAADTKIFGIGSNLDSLGLVQLIVCIEEQIKITTDKIIALADEKAMSQHRSPFRNIQSLSDYIGVLLEKAQ